MPKQAHARTIEQRTNKEKTDKMNAERKAHTLTRFCSPFLVGCIYFLSRFRLSLLSDGRRLLIIEARAKPEKIKFLLHLIAKIGVGFAEFPYKRKSGKNTRFTVEKRGRFAMASSGRFYYFTSGEQRTILSCVRVCENVAAVSYQKTLDK